MPPHVMTAKAKACLQPRLGHINGPCLHIESLIHPLTMQYIRSTPPNTHFCREPPGLGQKAQS
jgi:hypothetical protein